MSSKFLPVQIPPGVVTNPTKRMRSSNWAEVNLVRWVEGELQPIKGQAQFPYTFASRCKRIHGWYDLGGVYHTAYVCEQNVYVDTLGVLVEITPAGGLPPPAAPGQGGYGDLNYGDSTYGDPRAAGVYIPADQIPNAWSVSNFGQILLVMSSVDGRLLEWDPSTTADTNDVQTLTLIGSSTGGTFALTFNGQTTAAIQWDAMASDVQSALEALTNIGSGNVACTDGPLPTAPVTITFQGTLGNSLQSTIGWANNTLTGGTEPQPNVDHTTNGANLLLTQTSGSPSGRCFVVTQERFVVIFGMYNDGTVNADGTPDGGSARRFGWCDQEDRNAWNFASVTSQAGFLDIEPASPIMSAETGRYGTIFFTASKAYVSRYLGYPYIYNYIELADDCTPYSAASITATSSTMLWMSQQGMFSFDGTSIAPIMCNIRPWIFDDIDVANAREQSCAGHVSNYNEFAWFYPQSGQPYNTRVAIYNYKEGWWSQGQMSRSACVTSSYTQQPIMADGTVAFAHELGQIYAHADDPWAETFDLNLTSGTQLVTLKQVIPDLGTTAATANVRFSFSSQRTRSLGDAEQWSSPVPIRPDGYVDARVTGRDIRMRVSCAGPLIVPFTLGQHLFDYAIRGDR